MWAPDYVTTAELAAFMRISDNLDDAQLARAVTAASRAIDQATGRQFGLVAAPEARYYTLAYDSRKCRWFADIDDLMTDTGLALAYDSDDDGGFATTVDTGDVVLDPRNAAAKSEPWTRLWVRPGSTATVGAVQDGLRVTARWGWSAVPTAIVEAALLQASRVASRRDSPYGIAGTGEQAPALRILSKVDPDVEVAVRPYVRLWGAA